jgi:hypothetical protein
MADGKVNTLLNSKITLSGPAAIVAALATVNLSGTALGYTPDDPAAVYHMWQTDEEGNPVLDEEGNLIPAPIDTGDNAWMMTASALVLVMTSAGLAIFYGGLAGALLTGIFAEQRFTPWGDNGLAFGNPAQLYENAVGAFAALAWARGVTAVIIKVMDTVWPGGIRVTPKEEEIGLDLAQHGERAYVT